MSVNEIPEWRISNTEGTKTSALNDYAIQLILQGTRHEKPPAGVQQALIYTSPDGNCPEGHTKINSTTYVDGKPHRTVKCDDGATKELSSPG